ncbi:integrase catalytic domain-containing protein [Trichonephila clavipes]|nr:integrase catalytic domain-containing protein [Trichonephila clavipes]
MDATKVNIPSNIDLADKDFGIPGEIDMLIGCELFFELLRPNKIRSPCEKWLFQETVFGYIVKLWVLKLEWDEPLSNPIAKEWNDFVSTLPVIQNIHVPRLVIGKGRIIIHGFADASTPTYGAVLYAQSISEKDVSTRLLCSKSGVAPVKPIIIPHDLSKRSNNYTNLLHILSYIFRFLHNSRNPSVKRSGQLDYSEVNEAELCLIKNLQASAFQEEIEFLAKSSCNSKGKLFSLNPFLDGNQILRVGGRLQNSNLTYSQKHPAILPADHLLTKLIMIIIHNRNFHLGPQALLYCTRQILATSWQINSEENWARMRSLLQK